ncbi:MAG: DUF2461 domain-containing protein [Myxococcota bacterium]
MSDPVFSSALFRFLRELRKNNDRDWFQDQKERYERDARDPALAFVAGFAKPLRRISPHLVADPRPVGGSLFRIYRDVRFSKDKRPYKTHVGIHFRHEAAKDAHAPGLYLHLEPGDVFAAVGIWQPDGATLSEIRDAIVDDPTAWKRSIGGKAFRTTWALSGESLKRAPRGYDPEHPLVEDLKRKDFAAITGFTERDACAADFPKRLEGVWRSASPYLRFLTRALDLPW